jgi:hypothetical protein
MKKLVFKLGAFLGGVTLILVSYFTQPSAEINKSDLYTEPIISSESIFALKAYDYIKNHKKELLSIKSEPEKTLLKYLTLAERIDFKCTEMTGNDNNENMYGFKNSINNKDCGIYDIIDETVFGKNAKVKYCHYDKNAPKYTDTTILSDIFDYVENKKNIFSNYDFNWQITPRIRIDPVFANDFENYKLPVCCVIVINSAGDTILFTDILAMHFKDNLNGKYKGEYIEKYYFLPGNENLTIIPEMMTNKMTGEKIKPKYRNIKDIKIHWYGYCDIWLDYVRVENEPAKELLTKNDACIIDKIKKSLRNKN